MNPRGSKIPLLGRLLRDDHVGLVAGGAAKVMVILGLSGVLGFATQALLARWMGIREYGVYGFVLAWGWLLAVGARLGLPLAALRFVPQYRSQAAPGLLLGFVRTGRTLCLLAGVACAVLVTIALRIGDPGAELPYTAALLHGIWLVPLFALTQMEGAISRGLGHVLPAYGPPKLLAPLILLAAAGGLYLTRHDLGTGSVIALTIVAWGGAVGIQFLANQRALPRSRVIERQTAEWLRVAMPLLLIAGFAIVLAQTDIILVGLLRGPEDAGRYRAAVKIAELLLFLPEAVNALAAPLFSSLFAARRIDELQRVAISVARLTFWPSLGLAALLVVAGGLVLRLFGPDFDRAWPALAILAAGRALHLAPGSVAYLLGVTGNQSFGARAFAGCAALNVALNLAAIPLLGIAGAALATALCLVLLSLWLHRIAVSRLGIRSWALSPMPAPARPAEELSGERPQAEARDE